MSYKGMPVCPYCGVNSDELKARAEAAERELGDYRRDYKALFNKLMRVRETLNNYEGGRPHELIRDLFAILDGEGEK